MISFGNLIQEACSGTGIGPVTLGGALDSVHFTAASQLFDGDQVLYTLWDGDNSAVEVGQGVYTIGTNSISRDFIEKSTNADAAIVLSANTHRIELTWTAGAANAIAQSFAAARSGCEVYYSATTGYSATAGMISIASNLYENTAAIAGGGTGGYTVSSLYYLYAYPAANGLNWEVEESLTAAVPGQHPGEWVKSGDETRRMIGFFRTTAGGAIIAFGAVYAGATLHYLYADPLGNTLIFDNNTTADAWEKLTAIDLYVPVGAFAVSLQPQLIMTTDNDEVRVHLSGFDPVPLGITNLQASNITSYTAAKNTSNQYGNNIEITVDPSSPAVWLWLTQVAGVNDVDLAVAKLQVTL